MTARILAIANQKGGVGKTTTAAALLAAWADRGLRVAGLDLDPQASLTAALGQEPNNAFYRAVKCYIESGDEPPLGSARLRGGESLIAGHLDLSAAEVELIPAVRREYVLADLLAPLRAAYDVIIIDCPPSLGLLTLNALTAADGVLIPCPPEYLAVQGLARLMTTVHLVQRRLNRGLQGAGVVPTMVKSVGRHVVLEHRAMLDQIAAAAAHFGLPVLPAIPDQIAAVEAAGQGIALTRYERGNGAAAAYRTLADTLYPQEAIHAQSH
jgi:chromosome partitioning protein